MVVLPKISSSIIPFSSVFTPITLFFSAHSYTYKLPQFSSQPCHNHKLSSCLTFPAKIKKKSHSHLNPSQLGLYFFFFFLINLLKQLFPIGNKWFPRKPKILSSQKSMAFTWYLFCFRVNNILTKIKPP